MPFFQLGKNYTMNYKCELSSYKTKLSTPMLLRLIADYEEGNITTVVLAGIGSTAQIEVVDTFAPSGALQKITLNDDGSWIYNSTKY